MPCQHVLRHWKVFQTKLDTGKLLLLTDYDGTLVPIARSPDSTRLSRKTESVLQKLCRHPRIRVGIVSGRSLSDLRSLIRLPKAIYVGNHGCEIRGGGLIFIHPSVRRWRPLFRIIARQLRPVIRDIPGSLLEPKGLSLSVHWRQVTARHLPKFQRRMRHVLRPWLSRKAIRVTHGKRVIEIRAPVAWDKGRSVAWIVRHLPSMATDNPAIGPVGLLKRAGRDVAPLWAKSPVPQAHPVGLHMGMIYLGDDRTDEDAFRAVNRLKGLSIFVGRDPRSTSAKGYLASSGEVYQFLERLWRLTRNP